MRVASPVPGTVRAMRDVPDPVFAEFMVGPGVVLAPRHVARLVVTSPCDGTIAALHPHAFVVEAAPGRAVLVHVGIDTVRLAGSGFDLHREVGDRVRTGDRVLSWSPVDVTAAGLSTLCPVVALQAEPDAVHALAGPGTEVAAGDALLDWD